MASRRGKTTRGQDTPGSQEPTDAEVVAQAGVSTDAAGKRRPDEADEAAVDAEPPEPAENMFAEEAPRDQGATAEAFPEVEGASVVEAEAVTPRHPAETIEEEKLVELAEAETHVETYEDSSRTDRSSTAEGAMVEESPHSPRSSETPQAPVAPKPQPAPRRSGGFLAPLLGGVLAAVLGYGLAIYGWTQNLALPFLPQADSGAGAELSDLRAGLSAEAEARAAEIAALQSELEALRETPAGATDTAALEERLAAIEAQVSEPGEGGDATALAELQDRLVALEARPVTTEGDVDAGELAALRAALSSVQAEVERLGTEAAEATAAAQAAAEAAEAELAARTAEAETVANQAEMGAVLAQLSAALESGAPLAPGIDRLDAAGVEVPQALQAAREGVPSLAALQTSYPEAARAALSEAMATDAPEDPLDRIGSFLRAQVALRSLSPREGDDADAILSRAEAALRAGDLATALAEIETLPEAAQAPLAEWQAQARARLSAVDAVEAITAEFDPQ